MLHFLYNFTLYPLTLVYQWVYALIHAFVGNYGWALLCLALIGFALTSPLRRLAAKNFATQNIQQYSPLAQHLRASLALLLPLPFLAATYCMLGDFQVIQGQAFGSIADLGKPDGLLWGLNALPLLMTLCRLGAIHAASGTTKHQQIQQAILAGIFLGALYTAPSSLLVYWTGHNALLLLASIWPHVRKHLVFFQFRSSVAADLVPLIALGKPSWKRFGLYVLVTLAILLSLQVLISASIIGSIARELLLQAGPYFLFKMREYPPEIVSWGVLLLLGVLVVFHTTRSRWSISKKLVRIALVTGTLAWVSAYFVHFRLVKYQDVTQLIANQPQFFLLIFCSFVLLLLLFGTKQFWQKAAQLATVEENRTLFFSTAIFMGLIITVLSPSFLYLGKPDAFGVPFLHILAKLLPHLLAWLLFCLAIWTSTPAKIRPFLVFALLFIAFIINFNASIYPGNYGVFDHGRISHPDKLNREWLPVRDVMIAWTGLIVLSAIYYFRQTQKLVLFLQTISILIVLSGAFTLWTGKNQQNMALDKQQIKAVRREVFQLSPDQPNVLIFVLDSFTGGHMEEIMAKYPHLKERYQGFVWYPDTVAMGEITVLSLSSIYGGPNFSPEGINQQADIPLRQKFLHGFLQLPSLFSAKGFDVGLLSLPFSFTKEEITPFIEGGSVRVLPSIEEVADLDMTRWAQQQGVADLLSYRTDVFSYILSISLFKASPHTLKKYIYTKFIDENLFNPAEVITNASAIGMLPQSTTISSPRPTLKIFYSTLPHYPWHLPKDGLRPVSDPYPQTEGRDTLINGVSPEHIYTEKHTLDMIADYVDFLREKKCLDNTLIILVSDHCGADSRMLNEALGVDERGKLSYSNETKAYPGRPHALLMVKPLHSRKPFQTSKELMSIADVPAIACQSIGGCSEYPYPITDASRVREHYIDGPWIQLNAPKATQLIYQKKAVIKGSMFIQNNWTIQDNKEHSRTRSF